MKTRTTLFITLLLSMVGLSPTQAQQPVDYWNQPWNSNRGFTANRSFAPRDGLASLHTEGSRSDFERVRSAWENYRREAIRYQSRYGEQHFLRHGERFQGRTQNAQEEVSQQRREPRYEDVRTPSGRIRDVQSFDFESPIRGDYRDCPRRGAADTRPQLAPSTPLSPYRELDRRQLDRRQLDPRDVVPYSSGYQRETFHRPQPLRAVPMSRTNQDSRGEPGIFSTPKIDPAQLASSASSFFRTHLAE